MGKNQSYLVSMPKYGHIVFYEIYIHVQVATSIAPQIMGLSMLRSFGKTGPQIDQIWAWLSRGHRKAPGVRNPLKSSVTGPSLLANCYLEIKFRQLMAILAKLLDIDFKFVLPVIYINFDIQTNFEVNQTQIGHSIPKNTPKNH